MEYQQLCAGGIKRELSGRPTPSGGSQGRVWLGVSGGRGERVMTSEAGKGGRGRVVVVFFRGKR